MDTLGKITGIKLTDVGELTARLVTIVFLLAGIFFFIQIVLGGLLWINAGGDPKSLDSARARITNAVIGLVIVVAAYAISRIVLAALGIDIFREGGVTI